MKIIDRLYEFLATHPKQEKRGFDVDMEGWARCKFCKNLVVVHGRDWWCRYCGRHGHDPVENK